MKYALALIGGVTVFLLTVAMLFTAGWTMPPVHSTQNGFRGTGMDQLANPAVERLLKVANALQVRLDELLAPPRQTARFLRAGELPTRNRGAVAIRKVVPEPLPGLDLERMELPAGARMAGVPHTPGTREYLTCERGSIELVVAGERYTLAEGDVVTFRGDQRHGYYNPGKQTAIAYSAIAFAPTSAG